MSAALPLAAIGTGSYNGGSAYRGELLLLNLISALTLTQTAPRLAERRWTVELGWSRWRHPAAGCGVSCPSNGMRSAAAICSVARGLPRRRHRGSIVHTGTVHSSSGLLRGNAFVVRRDHPSGRMRWVFTADHQATALDADEDFAYVAFNSGELVVLRAGDGTVHTGQEVRVDGHRVVPLSLARQSRGRVVIGTLDGRVPVCAPAR